MGMTRMRTLHPQMFHNEELMSLPVDVRWTALGLLLYADDNGRESATAVRIRSAVWPMDVHITDATIEEHLLILDEADYLDLYQVGKRTYFALKRWQRVDRPTVSTIPEPPAQPDSRAARESFVAGERGREGEGEGERDERSEGGEEKSRPTPEGTPPSPFCRAHPVGRDGPCRNCGTARLRHNLWLKGQLPSSTPHFRETEDD